MFLLLGGRGSEPEVGEKGYGAITPCAHGGAQRLDWSTALVIAVVGAAPEMATLLPLAACGWGPPSGDQASKWVQFQPPSAPPLHALSSATAFRYRPPRGRLRWSWSQLIPGGRTYAPLSFRWSPWDPGGYRRAGPARGGCPPYLPESKIKSRSLFRISRDVKGLFLGVWFASSGVIVRLQLEDELHVRVGSSVRGVKGLLGLSPLGFISCLLRGKVKPLYIKRGDASI